MKVYVLALILCCIAPILLAQEIVVGGPDSCVRHKQICGITSSNPPRNHGDCCAGLKCHQPRLGSSGRCISEEANENTVCLAENQQCGFTTSNPPIHHGDCCQGFECKHDVLGAGGRCTNEASGPSKEQTSIEPPTTKGSCGKPCLSDGKHDDSMCPIGEYCMINWSICGGTCGIKREETTAKPITKTTESTSTEEESTNSTSLCLAENQRCGFTTSNPPIHHGDCCLGFDCKYIVLGAGGQCTKGDQTTAKLMTKTTESTTTEDQCVDNHLCKWLPEEECQTERAKQDCPKKCGNCEKADDDEDENENDDDENSEEEDDSGDDDEAENKNSDENDLTTSTPSVCLPGKQICGFTPGKPDVNHGDCCDGFECKYTIPGAPGRCIKTETNENSKSVCLAENQKCGYTTSFPPIHHGDCCQGFECKYEVLGAGGKCTMEEDNPANCYEDCLESGKGSRQCTFECTKEELEPPYNDLTYCKEGEDNGEDYCKEQTNDEFTFCHKLGYVGSCFTLNNEEVEDCDGICIPKDVLCESDDDCKSIGSILSGQVSSSCRNNICEYDTAIAIA